jgi:predicted transcriptional regulator
MLPTNIKAITIKEPWATQIIDGEKTIEYRTWTTSYRGPLLICVAKHPPSKNSGKAIGIVDLINIAKSELNHNKIKYWILNNPRRINPFPVRGYPGLFDVTITID